MAPVMVRVFVSALVAAGFLVVTSTIWPPLSMLVVLAWMAYAAMQISPAMQEAERERARRLADDDPYL